MCRVLIADPDGPLVQSYRVFLESAGFEVQTAASGLECLDQLRTFRPDVLVLEPELPWGWGDGVLAVMREDDTMPSPPVVVVSLSRAWDQLSVVRADIRGLYSKPLEPSRLALILHAVAPPRPADVPTLVP